MVKNDRKYFGVQATKEIDLRTFRNWMDMLEEKFPEIGFIPLHPDIKLYNVAYVERGSEGCFGIILLTSDLPPDIIIENVKEEIGKQLNSDKEESNG